VVVFREDHIGRVLEIGRGYAEDGHGIGFEQGIKVHGHLLTPQIEDNREMP
jgi:hypothetical protein